ncbi:universal stress protein [Nocardia bhagyanarayanae]|uniref:Nucleotide-binding universal stress UspA family protein n=1 Tax=Nocardia bhagyanarayanae TaxID=1215925 RepID=A0A543FF66_9NOCA|nr:universal stress protein [Nocardia bhagyanarayanae]TQM32508.1 nucleotide-binding universal stress UspA family protein [Nocardia bhagyanarayanae]
MSAITTPPVVVGVDGSAQSLTAVRWAAQYAARHRAPLQLIHALGVPTDFGPGMAGPIFDVESWRRAGRDLLAAVADTARTAAAPIATIEVFSVVTDGAPVPVLRERAAEARLVVVGSHGHGAFGRLLLGSVSTALVRHAHGPVAVIPDTETDNWQGPVVVGVDGSPCSAQAVAMAFEEAGERGTAVTAVHTWSEFGRYESRKEMQIEAEALLAESLAGYSEKYPEVPVTRIVTEDRPARRIMQAADGAQLIVLGSHGRGGFPGMTLGSVPHAVAHRTEVPLIVVRPRTTH